MAIRSVMLTARSRTAEAPSDRVDPTENAQHRARHKSRTSIAVIAGVLAVFAPHASAQTSDNDDSSPCRIDPSQKVMEFEVDSRLKLRPTGPLKAGEQNEIPLTLEGPPISCLWVDGKEQASVRRHADGSPYVVITPTRLGTTPLGIMTFFTDGGFSQRQEEVKIVPSDRAPAALILHSSGSPDRDTDVLSLGLKDDRWNRDSAYWEHLFPVAYYLNTKKPVEVTPDYLQFSVKQSKEKPVIEVSQDGGIKPLRVGDALLGILFGQTRRETCIQVRSNVWAGDNSRCDQLRPPQPAAPLETVWTVNPDGLRSEISDSEFFVSRLSITPLSHAVEVAQPFRIPLRISGGKIRQFGFEQKRAGSNPSIAFNNVVPDRTHVVTNSELEDGHLLDGPGDSKIFELIPVELGEETVRIFARFEDGGFDERFFHLHVEPTEKDLERINVNYFDFPSGHKHLVVGLKYRQLSNDVIVHDLEHVKVTVTPPNIIRFDSDGTPHELNNGTAVVSVRFGAVQGKTTAHVEKGVESPLAFDPGMPQHGKIVGNEASAARRAGLPLIRVVSLSDMQGVDFGPYLVTLNKTLETTWKGLYGPNSDGPSCTTGTTTLRFKILPNGYLMNGGIFLETPSGSTVLDRTAWGTVCNARYKRLPDAFNKPYLEVRAVFSCD
ncbi:hypothetical protein P8935_17275 [Telmatobacter sp. DSM 110680]|uniref:Secreted protein n=1 Tax=Telmatobacter sp. DSM 110680 TaxID=3036704 RepID=A0AAU7DF38_9BACT